MSKTLNGHIALVTGGLCGIGKACALRLAQEGARVAINGKRKIHESDEIINAIQQCGSEAIYVHGDVSKKTDVDRMFILIQEKLGSVDILVNNAGIFDDEYINGWSLTEDKWDAMQAVNLKGVFLCCATAIPNMITAGWGRIINISSTSGISGGTSGVHYAASKGGVIALTKSFASETAAMGITVNSVAPSKIATKMLDNAIKPDDVEKIKRKIPMGRFGQAEEIAEAVLYFAQPKAAFTTGQVLVISGGY